MAGVANVVVTIVDPENDYILFPLESVPITSAKTDEGLVLGALVTLLT